MTTPSTAAKNWASWTEDDDPVWTAADEYVFGHTHAAAQHPRSAPILEATLEASTAAGLPGISLSRSQGKFLALHCRTAGVTHALEIGTLGGYSALWLALENAQLERLVTVEFNPRHVAAARANIARADAADPTLRLAERIELLQGAGMDVLPRVRDDVLAGRRPRFGFVFIDADKVNNWNYFRLARDIVAPNAVIVVDNVVRHGRVADPDDDSFGVKPGREVIEKVGREPGVNAVVLQMVGEKGYDGWLWVVVD